MPETPSVDSAAHDVLAREPQERCSGWTIVPISEAADRISYTITAQAFGWLEEAMLSPFAAHDQHLDHDDCAICKAPHAPGALRVVIDAVLDAALADPEIAAALAARASTHNDGRTAGA